MSLKRKDDTTLEVLVAVPGRKAKGERIPVVVFLAGRGRASCVDDFRAAARAYRPHGWAVVAPEEVGVRAGRVDVDLYAREASWRQRVVDLALTLKRLKDLEGVDAHRFVLVAAGEDRGVAAFLAARLRRRLLGLVFLDAPEASPLEGFLAAHAHSKKTSLASVPRKVREDWVREIAAKAGAATAKSPFGGHTALWWQERLERSLFKDLLDVRVPILVVVDAADAAARRRAEGMTRFLLVNGRSAPQIEAVEAKSPGGDSNVEGLVRRFEGALPYLWRRARPVDLRPR